VAGAPSNSEVVAHLTGGGWGYRNEARLVELGSLDTKKIFVWVKISHSQPQKLTSA
jgi:hypothetical protein